MENSMLRLKLVGIVYFIIQLVLISTSSAHQGESHQKEFNSTKPGKKAAQTVDKIGQLYSSRIQSIFEKSCYDCHGEIRKFPWYYQVPGAKQLIDSDRTEAKKHLDMRYGFPFKGHGSVKQDLKAIKDVILQESMPPLRYKILHWDSIMNKKEKEVVLEWVRTALNITAEEDNL